MYALLWCAMQSIEGVGLASVACYLSIYLKIPLPRDTIFLGEVHYYGGLFHPLAINDHYLDFCVKEGISRIVGPSSRMQVLLNTVTQERYQGIELIELTNASEIVLKFFEVLRQNGA